MEPILPDRLADDQAAEFGGERTRSRSWHFPGTPLSSVD